MIKVSLIVLCGLVASSLLRRQSAALRHWVLAASIICAGVTPLLERIVPAWGVPLHPSLFGRTVEPLTLVIPVQLTRTPEPITSLATNSGSHTRRTALRILEEVWLGGMVLSLVVLGTGLVRLALLASRSRRVTDGRWVHLTEHLARTYQLRRRVVLLQSDHPSLPVTWGMRRPTIVVPETARDWSDRRIRIVLAHELAHIRRCDWPLHLLATLLRSVYWFNPLLWVACRRMRLESEQACDDAVLDLGVEGQEYAGHLLDIARDFKSAHTAFALPAPAMARPSSLERRVRTMLTTDRNRAPLGVALGVCVAAALALLTIPVAGLTASPQASAATFSGSVIDAVGKALPGTTLILTNVQTGEKRQDTSDAFAHFAFPGLTPGEYALTVSVRGFATTQGQVSLESGQALVRDVALQVGDIQEHITIAGSRAASRLPPVTPAGGSARQTFSASTQSCTTSGAGGDIVPPKKLRDMKPVYPQQQQETGVTGTVQIDARIGVDGHVKSAHLAAPADQALANATINAVQQWEFSQTLLDCVPVEVTMHVAASFVLN